MGTIQTKVTELLEQVKVPYRLLPHEAPALTVKAAAEQRGVSAAAMVKSILLRERKRHRYVMACVPGTARLDPGAVSKMLSRDWRPLHFAAADEIEAVTGYVPGAVTPLCLPDEIPVIIDSALADQAHVNMSSGDPMAGIEISAGDLIRLTNATVGRIAVEESLQ